MEVPFAPAEGAARLNEKQAIVVFRRDGKVADWLDRYPPKPQTDAEYRPATGEWIVKIWSGRAGQIALGKVDDGSGSVREAWTGPQVAWTMARGGAGAFGGRTINTAWVWLVFCGAFLLGLADLRRLRCLRNLDLLALLSFTISLRFFNEGEILWSVPLAYPPLVYLLGRCVWIARRDRAPRTSRPVWPVWLLAAAAVFLAGFRIGLNIEAPRSVIDVGFAGVIGGQRIVNGQAPYGNMPQRGDLEECGPEDADGDVRERIQTNGRCEAAIERGDTYGPVAYAGYVPATLVFEWSGKWDSLPGAHTTSILFDLLTIVALALVGFRFGGVRLAAVLAFAWSAYPFTAYVLNANTNDTIMPALLVFGFWLASSTWARGTTVALAGWTKFAALLLAPLWASYPRLDLGRLVRFAIAFAVATLVSFVILLLEPDLWDAIRTFWDRTIGFQAGRDSPFSLWGWGQYHAQGIPDLGFLQPVLAVLAVVLAVAAAFVPREKGPIELAALTAAILIAFQLSLTHWFYLYLPWFLPFVLLWLLLPRDSENQGNGMRIGSMAEALPDSESQSITAPSTRTPP